MSEFQTILRRGYEFGAVGTAILVLAGCGGHKPKVDGEFIDGTRIQNFHPNGSARISTQIVDQCDGHTLLETTTDIDFHLKGGKKVYDISTHFESFENSPICDDETITPEDFKTQSPQIVNTDTAPLT